MALKSGQKLGPYEIGSMLGTGGMGEVYRARDTRLDRTVAIKVLRSDILADAASRARFDREARTVSSLNHPHICSIYDVGHDSGIDFLVMEYVEGETLAERLQKGRLPFPQALRHAVEIARALHHAHESGIVHRDLKPGNIILGKSGVKLLDFGLAKFHPTILKDARNDWAALPTEKREAPVTTAGTLVGTPRYMAPEQFEGQEADARTDIFALGVVLYEMCTGRRAFEGESNAAILASILKTELPPVSTMQSNLPLALDPIIAHCLAKQPRERWQSAHDVALQLASLEGASPPSVGSRKSLLGWMAAALAVAGVLGWFGASMFVSRDDSPRGVVRFSIAAPEGSDLDGPYWSHPAVAPDGRSIAFTAGTSGRSHLWLNALDALSPLRLPGTEGAWAPFWSLDGQSIGFFADGKLKRIRVESGNVQAVCDVAGPSVSGSWGDGTIVFAVLEAPGSEGLYRVSASGGTPIRMDLEAVHEDTIPPYRFFPQFLPDGRRFLFVAIDGADRATSYVSSIDSPKTRLVEGAASSRLEYAPSGHLLGVSENTLLAYAFDLDRLRISEDPITIAQNVESFGWAGLFSASSGTLAYLPTGTSMSQLSWFDRTGRPLGSVGTPADYTSVRISPDETRLVVGKGASNGDIWIIQLPQGTTTRLTSEAANEFAPIWTPDGTRVVFSSDRSGAPNLFMIGLDGQGVEELTPPNGHLHLACDWTGDGRTLLYSDRDPNTFYDLWSVSLPDRIPVPVLKTQFQEPTGCVSSDGRWLAYLSDESGRFEVYVRPFPGPGEKRRLSESGGRQIKWRDDGRELYYLGLDNRIFVVRFGANGAPITGPPEPLFQISDAVRDYDVTRDGERFLVNHGAGSGYTIQVVVNWEAGLRP